MRGKVKLGYLKTKNVCSRCLWAHRKIRKEIKASWSFDPLMMKPTEHMHYSKGLYTWTFPWIKG